MSLKTLTAVYSASERKYTATVGDVKYLGVVFTSDRSRNKGIDTWIDKKTQFCVNFIAPW